MCGGAAARTRHLLAVALKESGGAPAAARELDVMVAAGGLAIGIVAVGGLAIGYSVKGGLPIGRIILSAILRLPGG